MLTILLLIAIIQKAIDNILLQSTCHQLTGIFIIDIKLIPVVMNDPTYILNN